MSNQQTDRWRESVQEEILEKEPELLQQYFEGDEGWIEFTSWLYSKEQDLLRKNLFSEFLTRTKSKEYKEFNEWCWQEYERGE